MELCEKTNTEGEAYYTMRTQWLPKFLRQNYYWIKTVLKPFVEKKKQNWEEFLEHVVTEDYKCDEVGLFLFARMFHMQIGVIVNGVAWTTHFKQDLNQYDVVLGYKGCCQFVLLEKLELCKRTFHLMLLKLPRIVHLLHLYPFGQSLSSMESN